jgi:hypothetical protein
VRRRYGQWQATQLLRRKLQHCRFPNGRLGNLEKCYHAAFKAFSRFRPFPVFRFFRMDYVTRQFINLTKKFRKELRSLISKLNSALDKQTEAIRESTQASQREESPPPEIITTVNLPGSIEVHQGAEDTKDEKSYRRRTLFVSWATFLAIAVYAFLVYLQYREMIAATGASQHAVVEARRNRLQAEKSLSATIEQFRLDQRAWLDIGDISKPNVVLGSTPNWVVPIVNTGKTPAFHVWHVVTGKSYPKGEKFKAIYTKFDKVRTLVAILPGPAMHSTYTKTAHPITTTDIQHLGSGEDIFYIYGQMTYDDVFKQPHHTHFCFYLMLNLKDLAACDTYNDAD